MSKALIHGQRLLSSVTNINFGALKEFANRPRIPLLFVMTNVKHYFRQLKIPMLLLTVNPGTFDMSFSKIINRGITRGGYFEEHWGDSLDTISASGSSAAFILPEVGLSVKFRRETESYRNFMDLIDVYRDNGMIYDDDGVVQTVGKLRLFFDLGIYAGHFESFTHNEEAERPYRFEYNFVFKVDRTVYSFTT